MKTLKKFPWSGFNVEMISFNLIPRILILIKVTQKYVFGDSAHRLYIKSII